MRDDGHVFFLIWRGDYRIVYICQNSLNSLKMYTSNVCILLWVNYTSVDFKKYCTGQHCGLDKRCVRSKFGWGQPVSNSRSIPPLVHTLQEGLACNRSSDSVQWMLQLPCKKISHPLSCSFLTPVIFMELIIWFLLALVPWVQISPFIHSNSYWASTTCKTLTK